MPATMMSPDGVDPSACQFWFEWSPPGVSGTIHVRTASSIAVAAQSPAAASAHARGIAALMACTRRKSVKAPFHATGYSTAADDFFTCV